MPRAKSLSSPATVDMVDTVNTDFLRTLVGYNARRAALSVIGVFVERMAQYELKVVDFSLLNLIAHNPGITSRQVCASLNILPPNLVSLVGSLDKRGLIVRRPHPLDGRAVGLYLTDAGQALNAQAEQTVTALELDATERLTAAERKTLIRLLQKVYD
jgi:DNA-binding MarR family transcriptional regulator